ncbi:MAG: hypothetical protein J07HX5_01997 [halophilic archaeon J07HX5]|jgi:Uncharacterized conserved protein|nr:MAG: hypothetical protein J07HX5_01997 [halophilic archaeon J07HX5]
MCADHIKALDSALGETATVHKTPADQGSALIEETVVGTAIGTPLPFEALSLGETSVATAFSPAALAAAETGVTPAELAISDYGTISLPGDAAGTELVSLYCRRHVAVVAASDIEPDMQAAYKQLQETVTKQAGQDNAETEPQRQTDSRSQVLATGPSATADMGRLVQGVHGPHDVHIVVVTDR